jgi:diguanylate cyclase
MKTFRSRVLWLLLSLVVAVQVATVVALVFQTNRRAERQAGEDLQVGAQVLSALMQSRAEQLSEAVQVLVADYGFKEAATSNDSATLVSVLDNSASRVDAQLAVLLDRQGQVLAATIPRLAKSTPNELRLLAHDSDTTTSVVSYLTINDIPYLLVKAPVRAPTPVATAVLGFAIDTKLANQYADLLKYRITFVAGQADKFTLVGSMDESSRAALRPHLAASTLQSEPWVVRTAHEAYMTWIMPLQGVRSELRVVLQKPLNDALEPYRGLRIAILSIALLALVAAIPFALRLAAQISKPLEKLARAAKRIESGNYTERVELDAPREFVAVANTLDAMQRNIADREKRILRQATHDDITGLPNRFSATDSLNALMLDDVDHKHAIALLVVEIVEFDRVRASFGFSVGDAVLCEVARRLAGFADRDDIIARVALAQFLLIARHCEADAAELKARQLLQSVRTGFISNGFPISLDARVGIALYPLHSSNATELQRRADTALFEAKEHASAIKFYEPGNDEQRRLQLALLGDLRRAISANELALHYQPKVDMRSHAVHGIEALVRWNHPQHGFLLPDKFVPLAESTGNIALLTGWVLNQALADLRSWQDRGAELEVSVNLSATDLTDPEFSERVLSLLRMHEITPQRLVLEVTESAVMRETKSAVATMERLRHHGVRFSVDDFGTGFSSLAQLKQLPVDEIKIDKSFVLGLQPQSDDAVIVKSTIDLGHNLGVQVVAEGVETADSWRMLLQLGCDLAQGYLVSKPIAADQVFDSIRSINQSLENADSPTQQLRALRVPG